MSGAVLAILNPTSGGGRATRHWWRLRRTIETHFPHLVVHETASTGDAARRAAEWGRSGETGAIVVVGGDGTIHEVVNALAVAGTPVPLGVIPSGTGNDFARNAGIPLDSDLAAERLVQGAGRRLDLGRLRFRQPDGIERSVVFVNSTSVGVSPAANRYAQRLAPFLPGRLCYVTGGVVALLTQPRRRFTVTEAGHAVHRGKTLNITIANGAEFGGGMRISPDSSAWDGVLERVIIGEVGLGRALLAFSRIRQGAHIGMREVTVAKLTGETTIEADGAFPVEADGHDYVADGALTVSVEVGALRVLGVSGAW